MRCNRSPWVGAVAIALLTLACYKRPQQGALDADADPVNGPNASNNAPAQAVDPTAKSPVDPPPEPAAEPPSPESASIRDAIARARELLAVLAGRRLTPEQQVNTQSAGSFTLGAAEALDEGDLERASVLSDKALTLLEAVASETEPELE